MGARALVKGCALVPKRKRKTNVGEVHTITSVAIWLRIESMRARFGVRLEKGADEFIGLAGEVTSDTNIH